MRTVVVHRGSEAEWHQVEGWVIGEPEGWLQLIGAETVTLHRLDQITQITVPIVEKEGE